MSLDPGHQLAHYEILEPIGKGGMGEVYRAKDSKLGRDVAIKVLPDELAEDEERLRRFRREAKVLAALNHPNIASIYGLEQSGGTHYLVLELVPGETLAERIARGPIPIDEALAIASKIAEALEDAREQGIVHRDLKPANIKLTPDDKIKVLDFGLAKALVEEMPEADSSMSPTLTRDATRVGVILGTAAYMSPEQAKGKKVDERADIWSFGVVLYEMLTGKRAFAGDDVSEVLAAVIKLEPEWEALPKDLSPLVRRMLTRCLQKDPARRLRHIGDAGIEIDEARGEPAGPVVDVEPHVSNHRWKALSLASVVVAISAMGVALWSLGRSVPVGSASVTRTSVSLPSGNQLYSGTTSSVAISPDGLKVAYVAMRSNTTRLFLRDLDELGAEPIAGSEGAQTPFFSPDSQWLAFQRRDRLMKVAVSGGAPVTISEVSGQTRGACWTSRDEIIFNSGLGEGLYRVSATGGEPQLLTKPDRASREKTHRLPEPLPGGQKILFTIATADSESFDDASIAALSIETGEYEIVLEGGTNARYSPSGHLVYARAGTLLAVPFDLVSSRVTGSPVPVEQGVSVSPIYGNADYAIATNGSLIYARGKSWGSHNRVVWVDRKGREQPLIDTLGSYDTARISSDGRRLALYVEGANANVWIYDIARATSTRLTFGFDNFFPVWSPDGSHVAFASSRTVPTQVFWRRADGSGEAEALTSGDIPHWPSSWSPDGSTLAVTAGDDLAVVSFDGERHSEPFLQTQFSESFPAFSPDGQWIAYQSNESGQNEVYVRPFPSAEGKQQVSTQGGRSARWNPRGNELFYANGDAIMAVDVEMGESLSLGEPRLLFEKPLATEYDVAPDGERFVMIVAGEESEAEPRSIVLVQNWFSELERLVPTSE